jgi:hypothetical protein
LVSWSYIVTCNKCGYISAEKLSEKKAKELLHSHVGGLNHCTIGHIKLMKVRTETFPSENPSVNVAHCVGQGILLPSIDKKPAPTWKAYGLGQKGSRRNATYSCLYITK